MSVPRNTISAGVQQAWVSFTGANSVITGGTPTPPPAGAAGSHALQLRGIQSMPSGVQTPDTVAVLGDDELLGTFDFASAEPFSFLINTGAQDLAVSALLQGSAVESINELRLGLVQPTGAQLPDVALIVNSRAQNISAGGGALWDTYIYPRVSLRPLDREQFSGREAASFRYQGTAQVASFKPTGTALTPAANGYSSAVVIRTQQAYPMTAFRATGNGTTTTFTGLVKRPGLLAATNSIVAVDGTQLTTGFTFDRVAGTITFATAPTAGATVVVLYGYDN